MSKSVDTNVPVVVASCDAHTGPLLREQLRPYCPQKYLEAFDDFADRYDASGMRAMGREHQNLGLVGHHDATARLREMDLDGVASEVLYHFSTNGEPFPFMMQVAGGLTNAEIGRRLTLALKTVRNYVSNVLAKIHAADRADAVVRARRAGLG